MPYLECDGFLVWGAVTGLFCFVIRVKKKDIFGSRLSLWETRSAQSFPQSSLKVRDSAAYFVRLISSYLPLS